MRILVTGSAGFIGFHLSKRLLEEGHVVIGLDNLNDYYDPQLKHDRLNILKSHSDFSFHLIDLVEREKLQNLIKDAGIEVVMHLAAQAGVRYSIENPYIYIDANIVGFINILEGCRAARIKHLVYASTSSVYGANTSMPFSVHDHVDHPMSLYAATKKANELMAHSYASLYGVPCTGLRFFTVYGPWGRPDMALFKFTKAILAGEPIDLFNHGKMTRDFTYVDDIVEGLVRIKDVVPEQNNNWDSDQHDSATSYAPYRILNIGGSNPVELLHFVEAIEEKLGKKAIKNMMPMQAGDVAATQADTDDLERLTGFRPCVSVETGISRFVEWYRSYYHV